MSKWKKVIRDVEAAWNFFCDSVEDVETGEKITFEISERRNDYAALVAFYRQLEYNKSFVVSFNGVHYDSPITNKLLNTDFFYMATPDQICRSIKMFSDLIIKVERWYDRKEYRDYKYSHKWIDIDLFTYWSKQLRQSKRISLKSLGIQLGYPVVQELPYDPDEPIPVENFDKVIEYNRIHDLGITRLLLEADIKWQGKPTTFAEMINLRSDAIEKYGFTESCYSWDGVKLGLNILIRSYCNKTGMDEQKVKGMRGILKPMKLDEIILDKVYFDKTPIDYQYGKKSIKCNSFYSLLEHLKQREVSSTRELSYRVLSGGVRYDIKSGGLHSYHHSEIVEPGLDKVIYEDWDVGSYYPTLGSKYGFTPRHLPGMDIFLEELRVERLINKKIPEMKGIAGMQKLALNGGYYGNLNNEYSPMYDPRQLLSVTINGQLFLLILCEWAIKIGVTVDSCNTDGVTFIVPKDKYNQFQEICHKWEEHTQMELEAERFVKVIRPNVNNYLAIKESGRLKKKGLFVTEPDLGNSCDELIVPKALEAYFVKGIPVRDFIMDKSHHIYDFCISQKVDKSYQVIWNKTKQQRLNRFYVSPNAPILYKLRDGKYTNMKKGWGVQLYNVHQPRPIDEYNIDYRYYIHQAQKVIDEIEYQNKKQLKLF